MGNIRKPILCSACLLGLNTRYDGKTKPNEKIVELAKEEWLIPICPEQLGGMSTPRPPQQLQGCSGEDILDNNGTVKDEKGNDNSKGFIKGAQEVLKLAKLFNVEKAILKQRSPSCGCGSLHDGSFTGKLIKGNGVTTALLKRYGIKVIPDDEI